MERTDSFEKTLMLGKIEPGKEKSENSTKELAALRILLNEMLIEKE